MNDLSTKCIFELKGGGGLVHQLRKSYSLTDLGHDESDYGASTEQRAITSDQGNYLLFWKMTIMPIMKCRANGFDGNA